MRNLVYGCLVALLWAGQAAGRDIFVDNIAGDDRFNGSQPNNQADANGPVRTLAKALRLAGTGDRIVLADHGQPYRESISLVGSRHSGTAVAPFTIEGNGAVLDGTMPIPAEGWKFYRDNRFRFQPPRLGQPQLFLDGRPAVQVPVGAMADMPPKLEPRQWCFHQGYLYFGVDLAKLPADHALTYAALPTGITLYHVEHVVLKGLTVQGFQVDGIQAPSGVRRVDLCEVTCRHNGRSGVTVGGACQLDLQSCQLGGNGKAQLLTLPYSEVRLRKTDLADDTARAWVDQGGRVYLDDQRLEGGRAKISREDAGKKPEAKEKQP